MLFLASKVINHPISEINGIALGLVQAFFVECQTGKILALKIEGERFVLFPNIKNVFPDQIVVFPDSLMLVKSSSIFRQKQNTRLLGNQVVTETGKLLGAVKDFNFDDISGFVVQYYVRAPLMQQLFKGQLIIAREQVVALEKERVIVRDDILREKRILEILNKEEESLAAGVTAVTSRG